MGHRLNCKCDGCIEELYEDMKMAGDREDEEIKNYELMNFIDEASHVRDAWCYKELQRELGVEEQVSSTSAR